MKKLLFLMLIIASSIATHAQKKDVVVYKAYQTEFYTHSPSTDKWNLETKNEDVNIDIVFYKDVINVQAHTPTLFKLYKGSQKSFDRETIYGVTFDAYEAVKEITCRVNYIYVKNSNDFVLSVVFEDATLGTVNLRYYCKSN